MMTQTLRVSLMQMPHLQYSIIDGQVMLDREPYYLQHIPAEWLDMEVKVGRSKEYTGMFREYTAPMKFYKDGARIVRAVFDRQGVEGKCYITVERLNTTTLTYDTLFTGALNFLEVVDDQGPEDYIQVTVLDSGIAAMIRANEDVEYEIPITGPDEIQMLLNPMLLQARLKYTSAWLPPYSIERETKPRPAPDLPGYVLTCPYYTLVENTALENIIDANVDTDVYKNRWHIFKTNQVIYNLAVTGQLNYYLKNDSGSTRAYSFQILVNNSPVYTLNSGTLADDTDILLTAYFNHSLGILQKDDQVSIKINFDLSGWDNTETKVVWESGNPLRFDYEYHTPRIPARGLRWYKVFEQVLKKMTNNAATLDTTYLASTVMEYQNAPYYTVLTSGDAVRGLNTSPYSYPVIKTKFSELFKDGFSRWGIGMHISGNTVHVRKMEYYFNPDNVIAHLGRPASIKRQPAKEYLAGKLRIGSRPQEHDNLNGRDDAHTTHIYKLPMLRTTAELDLTTSFYPSPYAIYFTWADTNLEETKDNKNDNNIFVIDIRAMPTKDVYRPYIPAGNIEGVKDVANYYNYGQTPKHCFFRHRKYLKSILFGRNNDTITYQTTDKNADLKTIFSNVVLDENADVRVEDLGNDILFIPVVYDLEVALPVDIPQRIESNPNGCLQFTDIRGREVKIFPLDVGVKWGRTDKHTIAGLLALPLSSSFL